MSWSGSTTTRYDTAEQAINDLAVNPDSDAPDQAEQVQAAKDAAVALVKSGAVVNDSGQDVTVTISGHANAGHKPAAGYANDALTVSVVQVTRAEISS